MAKGQKKTTRKMKASTKKARSGTLTIPQLRKAFDHMDTVVEGLRHSSKNSFADAVVKYREEWRKTFKRDLSPADAEAYLKFRFGVKSMKTRRRGHGHQRGGSSMPLAGAPLEYATRPGVDGVYGQFPAYQTAGLDRYYTSAITADCGKPNQFPTDGSAASQAGGGSMDGLFRPFASANPPSMVYQPMMESKGVIPYPSSDPVGQPGYTTFGTPYITTANLAAHQRAYTTDMPTA
jgi:hypothetical protein